MLVAGEEDDLPLEVHLGEHSEEALAGGLAAAEVPGGGGGHGGRGGVGAAGEVHSLEHAEPAEAGGLGLECGLGSAGLLLEGLLGSRLGLRLGSGLGLGLGLAAGDLLLLHDLLLQLLLPVDSLLDLVKQALGLGAARVEAVWSGLSSLGLGPGLGLRSGLRLGLWLPLLELRLLLLELLRLLLAARLLLELVLLLPGLLRLLEAGKGGAGRGLLLGAGPGGSEPVLGVRLQPPDVDVPGEARHRLAVAAVHDDLGHSAVAGNQSEMSTWSRDPVSTNDSSPGGVAAEDRLGGAVPLPARGSRAAVAAVPGLAQVAAAGGVWLPGAVQRAQGVNILGSSSAHVMWALCLQIY